jgi:cyclophilin family peptidyl-prolyl cis-trans isomerase
MTPSQSINPSSLRRAKLAALAAMFAAAACGGGGGGDAAVPPPPPPPDPTVSAMFVNPAALGNLQELMVTIQGSDLAQGLNVTSSQCATLTRSTVAPLASSAATAYYRCAVNAGATNVTVDASLAKDNSALGTASFTINAPTTMDSALAGEGAVAPGPTGQGGQPGTAMYSKAMTIEVTGTNVNQGLAFDPSLDCTGVALSVAPPLVSTSSKAYYVCRVTAFNVNNQMTVSLVSDPTVLLRARFSVPPPQVTLSMATVDPTDSSKSVLGDVVITLDPRLAPIAANNFLGYVNSGFYDGTIFDIIQALPSPPLLQGGRYPPTTDTNLTAQKPASAASAPELPTALNSYLKWTVAMSRKTAPADGPAVFVINTADNVGNNELSSASAVFGSVTDGISISIAETLAAGCGGQASCLRVPNFTIDRALQTR